MTNKFFDVKQGLKVGPVRINATTGNYTGSNVTLTGVVSAVDLYLSANVNSNLTPNSNGVLNLGTTTSRYKDIFLSNVIDINGQSITANTTSVAISGNVVIDTLKSENVETNLATVETINSNIARANTAYLKIITGVETLTVANANVNILRANIGYIPNLTSNVLIANTLNVNTITVNNQLIINSTTNSTSTDTGSLTTLGGVGIKKDLYVGGSINLVNGDGDQTKRGIINYNDGVESIDFNFNRP